MTASKPLEAHVIRASLALIGSFVVKRRAAVNPAGGRCFICYFLPNGIDVDLPPFELGFTGEEAERALVERARIRVLRKVWTTPMRATENTGRRCFYVLYVRECFRKERRELATPMTPLEAKAIKKVAAAARRLKQALTEATRGRTARRMINVVVETTLHLPNSSNHSESPTIIDTLLAGLAQIEGTLRDSEIQAVAPRRWNAWINRQCSEHMAPVWKRIINEPANLGGDSPFVLITNASLGAEGINVSVRTVLKKSPKRSERKKE